MLKFLKWLAEWVAVVLIVLVSIASVILLIVFGFSVASHFWHDSTYGPTPPIHWLLLGLGAGGGLLAAAAYYVVDQHSPHAYYCPNCRCVGCREEGERRRRQAELATATAVGVAIGSSISSGNSS